MTEREDGHAVHYSVVPKGATIFGSDDVEVGKVVQIMDNHREHILDGIVFTDKDGTTRFVDGPEVQRTFERSVYLNITAAEAGALGPPEATGVTEAVKKGPLGRLFGRNG